MANVNIKFNGKDYLLSCDDGQEESLKKLTSFLDNNPGSLDQLAKATTFKKSHLANGGSANVDSINSAWNKMTSAAKDAFKSDTKDNAQTHGNSGNVTIST